jgi:inosine-uridine nucleoside N-ribohydrolase
MAALRKRIPVILDTDIGDDIDDTWALVMLLKSPELDLKLVVSEVGNTPLRARMVAKMLDMAGRSDIPVGVGVQHNEQSCRQAAWVDSYPLSRYPGRVLEDGVQALIATIMSSTEPVTLIAIGPVPNLAEALRREPRIAAKTHFVGMHGSVDLGYGGRPEPDAEYNVKAFIPECQQVLSAPWKSITITPLDTCGLVQLTAKRYQDVLAMEDPVMKATIDGYRAWCAGRESPDPARESTTLYDTVAVYLAYATDLCVMETLRISVDERGFTVRNPQGTPMSVAMKWRDKVAFLDHLVHRLGMPVV